MKQSWYILGAGAIGCVFASSFHRAGLPLVLLQRTHKNNSREKNLGLDRGGKTENLSLTTSNNSDTDPIHKLLLCTKAYDVQRALSQVAHRLDSNSVIIILVNGMGFMDDISRCFPSLQFTLATTTEGAYRVGEGHYCHAGEGLTRLGQTQLTNPPSWFDEWSAIDRSCVWEPEIERVLWEKLAINCAINPLTALEQCHNGDLAKRQNLTEEVYQLCEEISQVSAAAGFHRIASNIHSRVAQVIADTAANQSSMLQDVLAGRRTENEFISGYLLGVAQRLGVSTPCNTALFERIQSLDQARSRYSLSGFDPAAPE